MNKFSRLACFKENILIPISGRLDVRRSSSRDAHCLHVHPSTTLLVWMVYCRFHDAEQTHLNESLRDRGGHLWGRGVRHLCPRVLHVPCLHFQALSIAPTPVTTNEPLGDISLHPTEISCLSPRIPSVPLTRMKSSLPARRCLHLLM